jgi:hypothetical protein
LAAEPIDRRPKHSLVALTGPNGLQWLDSSSHLTGTKVSNQAMATPDT